MVRYAWSCLMVLTMTPSVWAEERVAEAEDVVGLTTTDLRMRPDQQQRLLGQLFMAPIYFMGYISVHEGGHALSALSFGWRITAFEPYPHIYTYETEGDEEDERPQTENVLLMGSVTVIHPEDGPRWREAMFYITPLLTDIAIFTAADLSLQYLIDPQSTAAPFLLFGLMVTPLVDFVTGLNCMRDDCDMGNFIRTSGIPRGLTMMMGYSLALTALWRCLHQFRRIYLESRTAQVRRERAVTVVPTLGDRTAGLGVGGRF